MRRLMTHLCVVALLLASGSFLRAAVTTRTYSGSYNGVPCTVTVNWHNWSGLGPVDGRIKTAAGNVIPFTGSNSQSGVLQIEAGGTSNRLVRRNAGRQTSWVGSRLSFIEQETPSPTPTPTPSPTPVLTPESFPSPMVEESYSGSWKGRKFTAQMRWAPGDTPDIIRRGRGTVTLEDGAQFAIEGWQPSADSTEFKLAPDESGETYKTTKASGDDSAVTWESSTLTLTEKK